jgi:phage baseplate assembly protein W
MKTKLVAVMAFAAVAVSMAATAMTAHEPRESVNEVQVQAAIDGRLHDLLVQMRMQRLAR